MSAIEQFHAALGSEDTLNVQLYGEFVALYERLGVLPYGEDVSLRCHCPNRRACWPAEVDPKCPDRAGIAMPWLGDDYLENRIVVVGMNLHDWGGLDAHLRVCRDHIRQLRLGRTGKDSRAFATGAMTYVDAISRSMAGETLSADPRPGRSVLADHWHKVAFAEAIKCAPPTVASAPYPEMFKLCPPAFLLEELRILRPRVVLVLGRSKVRDPVRELLQVEWGVSPGSLERDAFKIDGVRSELISANHPSRPGWRKSYDQLVESLNKEPVGQLVTRSD